VSCTDALELLLPEAAAGEQALARKVATCLRLLAHSASPRKAVNVGLRIEGARSELEHATRERLGALLGDLLAHHMGAARRAESFLDFRAPALAHDEAWLALSEERAVVAGLPHVPAPGERPLDVASRLIANAQRLQVAPSELDLWRARLAHLRAGPRAGETAFLEMLVAQRDASETRQRALAGAVQCLLDRGAVRRAAALLKEHASLAQGDAELARLTRWVRLLCGDESGARALTSQLPESPPRLPAPLAALRRSRTEWLELLPGAPARGRSPRCERIADRGELGAALLAVFALGEAGSVRAVHLDCAPALRGACAAWVEGRDGACRRSGELEREMVACARALHAHARDGSAPRGSIDASILAAAVAPITDRAGELRGCVRIECEHHLLPSPPRLLALARAWRDDVLDAFAKEDAPVERAPPFSVGQTGELASGDPRGEVLRALVETLGPKTAQRRWWCVALEARAARLLAEGGGALDGWRERPGGARAVRRALVAAGAVRFDEPDPALSIASDAGSGLVVPVAHRGELLGLVAVESTRRRDCGALQAPLERAAAASALGLRAACFSAWHCEQFGRSVHFDVSVPATAALIDDLLAAARASGPVTLSGPAGCGKQILARWIACAAGFGSSGLCVHACGARDPASEELELFGRGTERQGLLAAGAQRVIVLDDLDRLAPAAQARLEHWLSGGECAADRPRLVLTCRTPLAAALERERLREDLARRLQRLELFVPPLSERRQEIPSLAAHLARRFAAELALPLARLGDEALALLWRQPWEGNVRELENVMYKLALCGVEHLGTAEVESVARRFRIRLAARVPPREADRALLEAALRTTRNQCGSPNKTRAAAYLGWDPDTLARRLGEAGLEAAELVR
jgi:hypothetical protein